jgi:hypothetical protein
LSQCHLGADFYLLVIICKVKKSELVHLMKEKVDDEDTMLQFSLKLSKSIPSVDFLY